MALLPDQLERLERQAAMLGSLRHENIVQARLLEDNMGVWGERRRLAGLAGWHAACAMWMRVQRVQLERSCPSKVWAAGCLVQMPAEHRGGGAPAVLASHV